MFLLDTNICIYLIRKKPINLVKKIENISPPDLGISSITLSELQYGVSKSHQIENNSIALTKFLTTFQVFSYDVNAASHYGTIRAHLEKKGKTIGSLDLLIAAHCRSLCFTLVTNNTREFSRVENLKIENWVKS